MVRYQHHYPLWQRSHRTLRQQISFPFTHANALVKTFDLDSSLRPIHHNCKTHSRVQKSNSWLSRFFFQNVGTGGGSTAHPSTSLFRTDIPINHPLKPLLEASLNSILQAVSPRTLRHSFRIGAATTAAHKGLSQQQIQELGRWSSEAFKSYIRSDRSHSKEAHQTLIGHPP